MTPGVDGDGGAHGTSPKMDSRVRGNDAGGGVRAVSPGDIRVEPRGGNPPFREKTGNYGVHPLYGAQI